MKINELTGYKQDPYYQTAVQIFKNYTITTTKKIEEVVVKAADVNHDGKVDLKDAVAAVKAVEDTTKVVVNKAKKITSKKKTK